MKRLRVLHLSDLHDKGDREKDRWKRDLVLGDSWDDNLKNVLDEGGPPDLICFTGDIADWGAAKEYERAHEFISRTAAAMRVPMERIFVVPGNHDIARNTNEASWDELRKYALDDCDRLDQWIGDGAAPSRGVDAAWPTHVIERQAAFRTWASTAVHAQLAPTQLHPLGYRRTLALPGLPFPVHIVGLDSAFLAGDDNDAQKLLITNRQVGRLLSGEDGKALTGLRIALCHHPLSMLVDEDRSATFQLLAERSDILLRGHLHEPSLNTTSDPDKRLIELAAGALYADSKYPNSINVIDFSCDDDGTLQGLNVRFRTWSQRAKWHDDSSVYKTASNGRLAIDISNRDAFGTPANPATRTSSAFAQPQSARAAAYLARINEINEQNQRAVSARRDAVAQLATLVRAPVEDLQLSMTGPTFGAPDDEEREKTALTSSRGYVALRKLQVAAHNGLHMDIIVEGMGDYQKPFPYKLDEDLVGRGSCNVLLSDGFWTSEKIEISLPRGAGSALLISGSTGRALDEHWANRQIDILLGDRLPGILAAQKGRARLPVVNLTCTGTDGKPLAGSDALQHLIGAAIAVARVQRADKELALANILDLPTVSRRDLVAAIHGECDNKLGEYVETWTAFDLLDINATTLNAKLEIELKPVGAPALRWSASVGLRKRVGDDGGDDGDSGTFVTPIAAASTPPPSSAGFGSGGDGPACFVSLQSFRQRAAGRDVFELGLSLALFGREGAMASARAFLRDPETKLQVVYGAGGVGKTRFVLEAARQGVIDGIVERGYGATEAIETATDWYRYASPDSSAVIVIDEPQNPSVVRTLIAELEDRAAKWKVFVAVRSQNDPVLDAIRSARSNIVSPWIELPPLEPADARSLAQEALKQTALGVDPEQEQQLAASLARISAGYPIWMLLALRLLKEGSLSELPSDRWHLAEGYLHDVLHKAASDAQSSSQLRSLLRWIALLQPLNREQVDTMDYVRREAGYETAADLDDAIRRLRERRAIACYGVNGRLVELRPDVMRDFVVLDWLTEETPSGERAPTRAAEDLVQRLLSAIRGADELPAVRRVMGTLGHLESRLAPTLNLLDPIVHALAKLAATAAEAGTQIDILNLASIAGTFRVLDFVKIARKLRETDVPDAVTEEPWGLFRRSRSELLWSLPWALFNVGRSASSQAECTAVLGEMVELLELESRTIGPRQPVMNDGKRATGLVPRLLSGEHGLQGAYRAAAYQIANSLLTRLLVGDIPDRVVLSSLVGQLLTVTLQDSWADAERFVWTRGVLSADSAAGDNLRALLDRVWTVLNEPLSEHAHLEAWHLLGIHHQDLNAASIDSNYSARWRDLLTTCLERCLHVITSRALSGREWFLARNIWDWHHKFETEPTRKRLADECEARFNARPDATLFGALLFDDESATQEERLRAAAAEISAAAVADLSRFFEEARRVIAESGDSWRMRKLWRLAWLIGERVPLPEAARAYAVGIVSNSKDDLDLAGAIIGGQLQLLRDSGRDDALSTALSEWMSLPPESKVPLLEELYLRTSFAVQSSIRTPDAAVIAATLSSADTLRSHWTLLGLAYTADRSLASRIERQLEEIDISSVNDALLAFWQGLHPLLLLEDRRGACLLSQEELAWFLGLVAMSPDLQPLVRALDYDLELVVKRRAKMGIGWLATVVGLRVKRFAATRSHRRDQGGESVWLAPNELVPFIAMIVEPSQDAVTAIDQLLSYNDADVSLAQQLPELVATLDPNGLVVPQAIARRLDELKASDDVHVLGQWARYGSAYPVGTPAWRAIADAAIPIAERNLVTSDAVSIYQQFYMHGTGVLSGPFGQVHPHWFDAVRTAEEMALAGQSTPLARLLSWRADQARKELEWEKGRVEEERKAYGAN